jgi:hypothetical protein
MCFTAGITSLRWNPVSVVAVIALTFSPVPAAADRDCSAVLRAPSAEACWLLLESEPVAGARDHSLHVLFASSPQFKEQIEEFG